jgi:hypothetical protein
MRCESVARWLSIIAHPFVMVGVMVGTATLSRQPATDALLNVALVALFTIVPLALLMVRQVRGAQWENVDASNRRERPILYLAGALSLAALLTFLIILRPGSSMVRGVAGTLGMFVICAIATKWVKVSLHMAFAALAATALALMGSMVGYFLVMMLPALGWARLTLKRHSTSEVALGAVAGIAAGAAIHYL